MIERTSIPVKLRAAHWAALLCLYCSFVGAALLVAAPAGAEMRRETLTLVTQSARHVIDIEVAETQEEKARGLMFRPKVPEKAGMLFPYGTPQEITMWMKNTYASLDMVFIKGDGVIHRIEANTEPLSERIVASNGDVTAVLELAAGQAAKLDLRAGDKVLHKAFGTAAK
jgi:uncharacterized protein